MLLTRLGPSSEAHGGGGAEGRAGRTGTREEEERRARPVPAELCFTCFPFDFPMTPRGTVDNQGPLDTEWYCYDCEIRTSSKNLILCTTQPPIRTVSAREDILPV